MEGVHRASFPQNNVRREEFETAGKNDIWEVIMVVELEY